MYLFTGSGGSVRGGSIEVEIKEKKRVWEVIQLDGNLSVEATPFCPTDGTKPDQAGTPGNEFLLEGEYQSFVLRWNRETEKNASVEIFIDGSTNGVGYNAGQGCIYAQDLFGFAGDANEFFCQNVRFKALPGAYVEIMVTRKS